MPRDEIEEVSSYWEAHVLDDGARSASILVKVIFPSEGSAVHQIIAWGAKTEIVEPPDLRGKVIDRAREVVAHHATSGHR